MPEHLRAVQGVALAHRRASRRLERDVRDALKAAVLADVKEVKAFTGRRIPGPPDERLVVSVTCRPWHDIAEVAAVIDQMADIDEVKYMEGGRTIIAFRKISGQK